LAKQKMVVSINIATSLDGKIATPARGPIALGTPLDRRMMKQIRAQHDVIVMGASTFLAYPKPLLVKEPSLVRARLKKGKSAEPATAIVSSQLDIPKGSAWELDTSVERIVFCGRKAKMSVLSRLEKNGVKVVLCKGDRPSPPELLRFFASQGFSKVLVEGGGELIASFLETDLVDQLFITLCPWTIGGREAPTFFEGQGFSKQKNFLGWKLKQCRKVASELYLIYQRI
jgi:riboflavin-specific deaminase-like protein